MKLTRRQLRKVIMNEMRYRLLSEQKFGFTGNKYHSMPGELEKNVKRQMSYNPDFLSHEKEKINSTYRKAMSAMISPPRSLQAFTTTPLNDSRYSGAVANHVGVAKTMTPGDRDAINGFLMKAIAIIDTELDGDIDPEADYPNVSLGEGYPIASDVLFGIRNMMFAMTIPDQNDNDQLATSLASAITNIMVSLK